MPDSVQLAFKPISARSPLEGGAQWVLRLSAATANLGANFMHRGNSPSCHFQMQQDGFKRTTTRAAWKAEHSRPGQARSGPRLMNEYWLGGPQPHPSRIEGADSRPRPPIASLPHKSSRTPSPPIPDYGGREWPCELQSRSRVKTFQRSRADMA